MTKEIDIMEQKIIDILPGNLIKNHLKPLSHSLKYFMTEHDFFSTNYETPETNETVITTIDTKNSLLLHKS